MNNLHGDSPTSARRGVEETATETRLEPPFDPSQLSRKNGETSRRTWNRLTWAEWLAVIVGVGALVQALRGKANSSACLFVPLILPTLLVLLSRTERLRALRCTRGLWASLDTFAAGGKTPWFAAVVFVVIPVTLLNLSNNHVETIGDTSTIVPTAVSLITQGDTNLDEFCREGFWWVEVPENERLDGLSCFLRRCGQHIYASHPIGMVPLAVPVVAASKLAGGRISDPHVQIRLEKLTAAALGGVSLGVFFLLVLCLVRPTSALATTALLAVASGMFTTVGQNLWGHDGIILGSLIVLLLEFRGARRWGVVAQGLVCGTMPACRLTAVSFLVPFGAWVLARSPRRALLIVAVAALAYLPWASYYLSTYGNSLGPSTSHMTGSNWSGQISSRLAGVLVSPGRGLVTYQPWVVLALLPAIPLVHREATRRSVGLGPPGWAAVCVAMIALDIGIVSAWHGWWSGWCWGSRLVVGIVPLCGLLCARSIDALFARQSGRTLVVALGLLGSLVQIPGVYTDAFRWNAYHGDGAEHAVWSWSDAPFLAPFTLPPGAGTRDYARQRQRGTLATSRSTRSSRMVK